MPGQDASWALSASRAHEPTATSIVRFTYEVPAAITSFARGVFHTSGGFPRIAVLRIEWTLTGNPVPQLAITSTDDTHLADPNANTVSTGTLYEWSGHINVSKSLIGTPQNVTYRLSASGGGVGVQSSFLFTWPQ